MGGGLSSADAPCCCAEVSDRLETLPEARLLEQVNACQESEASCQVLQWRPLPIPEWPARSSAAAAALGDGRVLLLGGTDGQSFLQEVWRRTELGGWQKLPIPPWSARMDAASVTLPSGEVWLVGGESADREPLREVWCTGDGGSTWKELPKPPWNARARCAVTVLSGSAVLVMGGWGLRGTLLGDVWLTEDNGHSWVQLSKPAWGPRESATAMTCEGGLNGIVLLVGGFNPQGQSLAEVWVSYSRGCSWQSDSHESWPGRGFPVALPTSGSSALILGGVGSGRAIMADVWSLNVTSGLDWEELPELPFPPRACAAAVVLPGVVMLLGGLGKGNRFLQDAWCAEVQRPTSQSLSIRQVQLPATLHLK